MAQAETRRLAAIMFTDMVGFSRQMGASEARMLRLLAVHNQRGFFYSDAFDDLTLAPGRVRVRTKRLCFTKLYFLTARGLLVRGFAERGIVIGLKLLGKPGGRQQQHGGPKQDNQEQQRQDTTSMHRSRFILTSSVGQVSGCGVVGRKEKAYIRAKETSDRRFVPHEHGSLPTPF